ncbi:MAG: hypothetical protein KDC84_00650 [Crocinitomicaceae bacterium]|nr:hypothetical protein [Crocinitomicaceae bacterium]
MQHSKEKNVELNMLRFLIIGCFSIVLGSGFAQVQANDSLYQNFTRHNKVDSLYLYQKFKWKGNEFELIGVEKVDPFVFEISSKGGLINITTPSMNEDFIYKGEKLDFMGVRLDSGNVVMHLDVKGFLYEDQNQGVESYFYFFLDQTDRIYRMVKTKKREDILLYFISPKDN